ncbi:hypothetical protein CesoFtcFv8_004686 [Champsocephalus esox]|uniref:Uncharacterized protein n=2 Tax=Champsocephalus TaxID=52236 RepID=A0AAN8HW64_CHAGU|nr:hypothetical protein CesoFtcFv8_004686 [Champsocephalus esox]KAK5930353.1 hypothetical protein CgunFtcFv8_026591 [Champsocephalus gunnari]
MNALQVKASNGALSNDEQGKKSLQPTVVVSLSAYLCAQTAVTLSGIIKESALPIMIPGQIKCSYWKSVSSQQCATRHPKSESAWKKYIKS